MPASTFGASACRSRFSAMIRSENGSAASPPSAGSAWAADRLKYRYEAPSRVSSRAVADRSPIIEDAPMVTGLLNASNQAEHAALADAAPHQFNVNHLMVVDVEIDRITERPDVPRLGCGIFCLENEIPHIELGDQIQDQLVLHRLDALADAFALHQHLPC